MAMLTNRRTGKKSARTGSVLWLAMIASLLLLFLTGCATTTGHLRQADTAALNIIQQKQQQALGRAEEFEVERPSDILRRRLLIDQGLPYKGEASLGADKLKPIDHWPEKDTPEPAPSFDQALLVPPRTPLKLTLIQALQAGARNSPEYQSRKEDIFRAALDLDLKRDAFRFVLTGEVEGSYTLNKSGSAATGTMEGFETSGLAKIGRTLYNGTKFAASLAIDLVKLLTPGSSSSLGIVGDTSISIPLLRGSGRHIVTEPLTQAERNVVYAIYD
ncbi:MAG: hypothetical protein JRD68_12695, partial [Deltaproteobacteria bacterium]|nr:hypothetical protein [Deltaproteobacteria bacterium]